MSELPLSKIVHDRLDPRNDYFREAFQKRQIYLHHSYSHADPATLIYRWRKTRSKVASALLVAGPSGHEDDQAADGTIFSAFASKYWAVHLGIHAEGNGLPARYKKREHSRFLEKHSVSLQICSAGPLSWENGKFYTRMRTVVPENQVIEYVDKFREKRFFQKYSSAQIESLRLLLHYLCDRYQIPRTYYPDMWDISENALMGAPGIFTHVSVRTDKTDCHPQPELLHMLQELENEASSEPGNRVDSTSILPDSLLSAEAEDPGAGETTEAEESSRSIKNEAEVAENGLASGGEEETESAVSDKDPQ